MLKVLFVATKLLQDHKLGLSDFYRIWLVTTIDLDESPSNHTNLARCLQESLHARKRYLLENPALVSAVYLDLRFKCELNEEEVNLAKLSLIRLWNRLQELNKPKETEIHTTPYNKKLETYFSQKGFSSTTTASADTSTTNSRNITELEWVQLFEKYDNEAMRGNTRLHSDENILKYWHGIRSQFPELFTLACIVHAIPPSQCVIEQYFSTLAYVFGCRRSQLKQATLEQILMIKLNRSFFEEICEDDLNRLSEESK